jgi:tetratricopeptide (TPR) repeat protein
MLGRGNSSFHTSAGVGEEAGFNRWRNESLSPAKPIVSSKYEAILDEASQCYYYWNKETGQTTWDAPEEQEPEQSAKLGVPYTTSIGGKYQKSNFTSKLASFAEDDHNGDSHDRDRKNGDDKEAGFGNRSDNDDDWNSDWNAGGKDVNAWAGLEMGGDGDDPDLVSTERTEPSRAPRSGSAPRPSLDAVGGRQETWGGPSEAAGRMVSLDSMSAMSGAPGAGASVTGGGGSVKVKSVGVSKSKDKDLMPGGMRGGRGGRDEALTDVSEMLESEEDRAQRKFKNMRRSGAIMLSEMAGWEQWRSPHGAVFYAEAGTPGGQWKAPFEFPTEHTYGDAARQAGGTHTIGDLHLEYAGPGPSPLKATPEAKPISSPSPDRGKTPWGLGESGLAPWEKPPRLPRAGSVDPPSPLGLLDRAFQSKPRSRPGDEDDPRTDPYRSSGPDEEFDPLEGGEEEGDPKAVDHAQRRLKEIYASLRFRDRALDSATEENEIKRKADMNKAEWEKYLDKQTREDLNRIPTEKQRRYEKPVVPSAEPAPAGGGDDEEGGGWDGGIFGDGAGSGRPAVDFNLLYARSVIVKQRWPWTALVDVQTDRHFYRNELEDYFQLEPPPEMVTRESETHGRRNAAGGSRDPSRDLSKDEAGLPWPTDRDRPAPMMSERYKAELQLRRDRERARAQEKVREAVRLDPPQEPPPASSRSGADQASSIIERLSKQMEYNERIAARPAAVAKALYAPPSHSNGRLTSMFNINMSKFVRKYNPMGDQLMDAADTTEEDMALLQKLKKEEHRSSRAIEKGGISPSHSHSHSVKSKRSGRGIGDYKFIRPPCKKMEEYVDLGWIDAQTLLRRLRWFSADHDGRQQLQKQAQGRSGGKRRGKLSVTSALRGEGTAVKHKWSRITNRMAADLSKMGHSGVDLVSELRDEMAQFALIRARRVGKNAHLNELKAAAAIRKKIVLKSKEYVDKVNESLESIGNYLYEDDETIMTQIESEIYRRHALEAAVLLKSSLVRPISTRDLKAYSGVPKYALCPQAAVSFDPSLPRMESHKLPSRMWQMLQDSMGRMFFCDRQTGQMQGGEPFDIEFKRLSKTLKYERWFDFGRKNIFQEQRGRSLPPEIMSDAEGGLLFYCPAKKLFSWREQISVGYYDLAFDEADMTPAEEAIADATAPNLAPDGGPAPGLAAGSRVPTVAVLSGGGAGSMGGQRQPSSDKQRSSGPESTGGGGSGRRRFSGGKLVGRKSTASPSASLPGGEKGTLSGRGSRRAMMSRAQLENRSGDPWESMKPTAPSPQGNATGIPTLPAGLRNLGVAPGPAKAAPGPLPDITEDEDESEGEEGDESEEGSGDALGDLLHTHMTSSGAANGNGPSMSMSLDTRFAASAGGGALAGRDGPTRRSFAYTAPLPGAGSGTGAPFEAGTGTGVGGAASTAPKNPFDSLLKPSIFRGGSSGASHTDDNGGSNNGGTGSQTSYQGTPGAFTSGQGYRTGTATWYGPGAPPLEEADLEPLEFEEEMADEDYDEYCRHVAKVQQNPNDIRLVLDLADFLLSMSLHKEGLATLTRVLDLCMLKPLPGAEFATVTLLVARLSARYLGEFRLLSILKDATSTCPENPQVLCLAAKLYEILQIDEAAEQLYVGAMLVDPDFSPALEGYASLLMRQGNLGMAARYLSRTDARYAGYPVACLKLGWMQEILGAEPDAVVKAYQSVLGLNLKNRPTVQAQAALGHFYHVRGDLGAAIGHYRSGLRGDADDVSCLVLHACALASSCVPGTYRSESSQRAMSTAHSHFRRGLFFNQKGSNRWVGLLAYADFLYGCKQDAHTAEDVLWEATRASCQHAVWPTIALIHHFQYARGNLVKARRVIHWVTNRRTRTSSQSLNKRASIKDARAGAENLLPGEYTPGPMSDEMARDLEESVALMVAEAYCCYDASDFPGCGRRVAVILATDKHHISALRLEALLSWAKGGVHREQAAAQLTAARQHGNTNVFFLRSYSVASALMGDYSRAVHLMAAAVELCPLSPLAWRALGLMSYLYEGDREHCLEYFARAFALSGGRDLEAIRLRGQVLMELGQHEEARAAFKLALGVSPADPVSLASLAMCLTALGYRPESTAYHTTNYDLKFQLMDDLSELAASEDPQELMEAAICTSLVSMVAERKKRVFITYSRDKANPVSTQGKGWDTAKLRQAMRESKGGGAGADAGAKGGDAQSPEQDVCPSVLYWFGLYCLHRGSELREADLNFKAKILFKR